MSVIAQTERLIVREWTDSRSDLDRIWDTYRRVEVTRWLGNPQPLVDEEQAVTVQSRWAALSEKHDGRYGVWAVQVRETGVVAGSVLLVPMPDPTDGSENLGEIEVGWHLHPDSWGFGYATEAAGAVLRHGFGLGLDEILAIAKLDNDRSLAVMQRLGMVHRGRTSRWYGIDAELYAIAAEEKARRSATMGW